MKCLVSPGITSEGLYGLLKFFRNENYLDAFIDGTVHFSTPETFRLSKEEGVGDADESASATFRRDRGDEDDWEIRVENDDGTWTSVPGIQSITIRNTGQPDRWLHCWMELGFKQSDDGLQRLGLDLERVLDAFGRNYVLLPAKHIGSFMRRLRDAAPEADLGLFKVKYSDEPRRLGPYCKRVEYAYQREVRIMLDECDDHETEARQIKVVQDFSDLVSKNPGLRLTEDRPGGCVLRLTRDGTVEWSTKGKVK